MLLFNPPAPQTGALLRDTDVMAVDRLGASARDLDYNTVWTAVLGYDVEIEVPYYGLRSTDPNTTVGWIGREECKPGHVPEGQSVLVVQARPSWSAVHYDAPPEKNIDRLSQRAADLLGDPRLTAPDWTDWQGWKYAFPDGSVDDDAHSAATREGVYVCGDWVAGTGRLDAAIENGLTTGAALADALA
ncbi:MAG: FAD-dependent oxidoreductase [Salinivenus sp.]